MKSLDQALSSQIFTKNSLSQWEEKMKSELEKSHIAFEKNRKYLFTKEDILDHKSLFSIGSGLLISKSKKFSYGTSLQFSSMENTISRIENCISAGAAYIFYYSGFQYTSVEDQRNIYKALSKYKALIHYVINTHNSDVINEGVSANIKYLENITLTICTKPSNLESLISQEIFKKNKIYFLNIDCKNISVGQTLLAFEKCLDHQTEIGFEKLYVSVSVGEDFFYEISKLRALRFLLSVIISETKKKIDFEILAVLDLSDKEENHIKILSATTAETAAIIGGADGIVFEIGNNLIEEKYTRVFENMTAILSEESKLESQIDPTQGSYFIESLTYNIAKDAWEEFVS